VYKLLAVVVVALCAGPAVAQNPQSDLPFEVSQLKKDVAQLKRQVSSIEARLPQSDLPPKVNPKVDPWNRPDGFKSTITKVTNAAGQCCCSSAPGGVGTCGKYTCPANGDAPGPCPCQTGTGPGVPDGSPRSFPIRIQAAPVVAAPVPFDQARYITPGTTVLSADGVSSYRPAPVQSAGLTYTVAPRGTFGITSGGCANGNCAAPARRGLFR
jgi:hypothetical protein